MLTRRARSTSQVSPHSTHAASGIDGSEGITALAVSPLRKHIAICERAERAICVIYDISGLAQNPPVPPKRKKILSSQDYQAKDFISVCFAPTAEKSLLATLVSLSEGLNMGRRARTVTR